MGLDDEFARVFHIDDFDTEAGRFRSVGHSKDGISVSCVVCAEFYSSSICSHIRRTKATIASEPPIFWKFKRRQLPVDAKLVHCIEDADICHHNLMSISQGGWKRMVKSAPVSDFYVCVSPTHVQATIEMLGHMKETWEESIR